MSTDIIAPRYEPATAFHPPRPATFVFGVDNITIEELFSTATTAAIVRKHAPWTEFLVKNVQFAPFMSVFTLSDATPFMPVDVSSTIRATDAALKALPLSDRPAYAR
jgi:hypothetical protein